MQDFLFATLPLGRIFNDSCNREVLKQEIALNPDKSAAHYSDRLFRSMTGTDDHLQERFQKELYRIYEDRINYMLIKMAMEGLIEKNMENSPETYSPKQP